MTYSDPDKQKEFQRLWRRTAVLRWKEKAVELLGGKCKKCGYKENIVALQIDHVDPVLRSANQRNKKEGSETMREVATGKCSLKKLQLLCANCHAIKTYMDRLKFKNFLHE